MGKKEVPSLPSVQAWLRAYFPDADWPVEREHSGRSTYVFRIRAGEKNLYLRILPEAEMSFGVEVHAHELLRRKGVQVPEVIAYENYAEALGMSVMLVREIIGDSAGQADALNRMDYENVMRAAGRQIALVHQVPVDGFGWIRRGREEAADGLHGENSSSEAYVYEGLEQDLGFLSQELLHGSEISRIRGVLKTGLQWMTRHEARLVHGDFDDSHIFQDRGSYTGLIDFGEMQGSSPMYDLGHFKLHDGQRFAGYEALTAGYGEVTPLTPDDQLEISLWALWIGVRRLAVAGRRPPGSYRQHLTKAVRQELDLLGSRL